MPFPVEYQRATDHFHQFLADARDEASLQSVHQAYTMAQGVFRTFRRRLKVEDAIRFSNILPASLRALFVADWDVDEPRLPFEDRAIMTKEVQSLRPLHNFSPESSIHDVASALRRNVDHVALDRVLTLLPEGAREFWQTQVGVESSRQSEIRDAADVAQREPANTPFQNSHPRQCN